MTSGVLPTIGPYSVERELGRGGMGVVYLARDGRLDRAVAIKALPESLASDPDRLVRFEREARTLAQLSHPNVGAIFGLEEQGGRRYLILEYIEGDTLSDRLRRGPLPVDEALEVAAQIAAGIEAAHEAGIIHRDLKPANIKLTAAGKVKVLDFGLAKALDGQCSTGTGSSSLVQTMTSPHSPHSPTIPGLIMGSAGYMSPEQARGKPLDKRSDIFSFGCILYEMLTGASPFVGESIADSIGAVTHRDADLASLPPGTPALVLHVLSRCLERDRGHRLHDIADARIELETAARDPGASLGVRAAAPTPRRLPRDAAAWTLVLLLAAALAAAVWAARKPSTTSSDPARPTFADINPPPDTRLVTAGDIAAPVAIAPDGETIVFAARAQGENQQLWLRRLDKPEAEPLPSTDGATFPFWAPDGRAIGFFAGGKLRTLDLATRAIRTVCEASGGRGGTWTSSGLILFSPAFQSPIYKIPAAGGAPEPLTRIENSRHTSHRWPFALPDGKHFLFSAVSHDMARREESALYLASIDGGTPIQVLRTEFSAEAVAGRLLFVRENRLMGVAFNDATGEISGEPAVMLPAVAADLATWKGCFSASASGVLAYHRLDQRAQSAKDLPLGTPTTRVGTRIAWNRRDGRPFGAVFRDTLNKSLALSRDGRMLAASVTKGGADADNIWIQAIKPMEDGVTPSSDSAPFPLTFGPGNKAAPVWSPDGKTLAFASQSAWAQGLTPGISLATIGGGSHRVLLGQKEGEPQLWPTDWSRDGRFLIFVKGNWVPNGTNDLWALPMNGGDPIPLVTDSGDDGEGVLSQDGRWLAYVTSDAARTRTEVFVRAFAPGWTPTQGAAAPSVPEERWRISIAGGRRPRWRADGKEIYFLNPSGSIIAINVTPDGDGLRFNAGTALFQVTGDAMQVDFDVTADGQFFFVQESDALAESPISLVLNWPRLLAAPQP